MYLNLEGNLFVDMDLKDYVRNLVSIIISVYIGKLIFRNEKYMLKLKKNYNFDLNVFAVYIV